MLGFHATGRTLAVIRVIKYQVGGSGSLVQNVLQAFPFIRVFVDKFSFKLLANFLQRLILGWMFPQRLGCISPCRGEFHVPLYSATLQLCEFSEFQRFHRGDTLVAFVDVLKDLWD